MENKSRGVKIRLFPVAMQNETGNRLQLRIAAESIIRSVRIECMPAPVCPMRRPRSWGA